MIGEPRCRSLAETLALARAAAARAGVTRVADVTAFAVPGIPVFQAVRPDTRSLSVSQGKGLTPAAAIVGALLESVEMWAAERLAQPAARQPLRELGERAAAVWSGARDPLAITLDPALPRAWLPGTNLMTGAPCPMPWDLLSLDFTQATMEHLASSNGLACGNNRAEALVSGVAQLLEHHCAARFMRLAPLGKRAQQISLASIGDPLVAALLRRVRHAGFEVRAWSQGNDLGLGAIEVILFERGDDLDALAPVKGNGCHPSATVAFVRALLEAVQSRAMLVAGSRDDVLPGHYGSADELTGALFLEALAFGDGPLAWADVPTADCPTSEQCLDFLLAAVERLSGLPAVAFDHPAPVRGLHLAHVLAPGLLDPLRLLTPTMPEAGERPVRPQGRTIRRAARKVLFAGPSIAGLQVPEGIEVHPPARCGDLAALLGDPPDAVALVDGVFRLAPTVWHKEILSLLAVGTRVIGGASLGALRAAELERFGMEGVGAIFHGYRSGLMTRDDAVMLIHAPAELGHAPLSLPLVDAEYALAGAPVPPRALRTMLRIVRTTPYETRTWRGCLAAYRERTGAIFPVPLETLEAAPSVKRLDAGRVIEALGEDAGARRAPCPPPPLTSHYLQLLASTARASAASRP